MAKKVVATLRKGEGRLFTRCIKMVKSEKTGAYAFQEEVVHNDHIKDFFWDSARFFLIESFFFSLFLFLQVCRLANSFGN